MIRNGTRRHETLAIVRRSSSSICQNLWLQPGCYMRIFASSSMAGTLDLPRSLFCIEVLLMAMRRVLLAAVVVGCTASMPAFAEPVPSPLRAAITPETAPPQEAESASVAHSAMKATTFKAATTAVNLAILSYATGSVVGGGFLAAFQLGASWIMYTTTDYLWDKYDPVPPKQAGQEFDATADLWRNTKKYMTYKPVIASVKLLTLYAYTGSAAIAGVFGGATIVANAAVFYANNMAWDFYDWYTAPTRPATAHADKLAQQIPDQTQR